MRRVLLLCLCVLPLATSAARAWTWDGNAWADYSSFLGPIDSATKANLQAIVAVGVPAGRVEGRLGQIGDSITESSAYFRNAVMNGASSNETGHDYVPIRSWLSYSGLQPPDATSFYRDHGKGPDYGNLGGWWLLDATNTGHPSHGVLTGNGTTPGNYSWALIMFGTNDIDAGSWSVGPWKESLRSFVQGYAALGVLPALSTIPPESAHLGDGRVEAANTAILELADEEQIPWVDFHGLILHHQPTNWHGTLIGGDGTHPSAATGGRGFSQVAQTQTDGYALRTKLTFDLAEKLRAIVWNDGPPDSSTEVPDLPPTTAPTPVGLAAPNPFRESTTLLGLAGPITLVDVRGRVIRTLTGSGVWNGTDDAGRPVPGGVYWALPADGSLPPIRVVRLR